MTDRADPAAERSVDPVVVAALARKYAVIRELRIAHADGSEVDPRDRMRQLAQEFPGALRELDELPFETIEARLAALGRPRPPRWADAMGRFHGWVRLALAVKRRFTRGSDPSEARRWLLEARPRGPGEPPDAALTDEVLAAILRPPGGRLSRWALERVALEVGRTVAAVEGEIFECLKKTP